MDTRRRGVRRTVLGLVLGGLLAGGGPPAAATTGSSGPVTWEVLDVTQTARADGRAIRWDYVIVLRETRGVGIRFEKTELLTSTVVSVNGVRVHEQTEPGTRALALNVPVTLREGTNVIVVSATDAQGAVCQAVRSVVHEPSAGIRVSYRVRGAHCG
jgi:hypothetical protein